MYHDDDDSNEVYNHEEIVVFPWCSRVDCPSMFVVVVEGGLRNTPRSEESRPAEPLLTFFVLVSATVEYDHDSSMLARLAIFDKGQGRVRGEVSGQRECMCFYAFPKWDNGILPIPFTISTSQSYALKTMSRHRSWHEYCF